MLSPQKQLSSKQHQSFNNINTQYSSVFNPNFGSYNDASGPVRLNLDLGQHLPPPRKGRLPSYNSTNLMILQEKFDELEHLGIIARPEDLGMTVLHSSPSFLVKKKKGGHHLVTRFVELNKYIGPLPIKMPTTDEVLRSLSKWKYIIISDLKSAFFQIKVSDSSMKWLGTATPYKSLCVYTIAAMGLRNSSECLEEMLSRVLGDLLAQGVLVLLEEELLISFSPIG